MTSDHNLFRDESLKTEAGWTCCASKDSRLDVARLHSIPILDHLVLGDAAANGGKGFVSIRARHPDLFC